MAKAKKCKRYYGKQANVCANIFFEDYMSKVASGTLFVLKNDKTY